MRRIFSHKLDQAFRNRFRLRKFSGGKPGERRLVQRFAGQLRIFRADFLKRLRSLLVTARAQQKVRKQKLRFRNRFGRVEIGADRFLRSGGVIQTALEICAFTDGLLLNVPRDCGALDQSQIKFNRGKALSGVAENPRHAQFDFRRHVIALEKRNCLPGKPCGFARIVQAFKCLNQTHERFERLPFIQNFGNSFAVCGDCKRTESAHGGFIADRGIEHPRLGQIERCAVLVDIFPCGRKISHSIDLQPRVESDQTQQPFFLFRFRSRKSEKLRPGKFFRIGKSDDAAHGGGQLQRSSGGGLPEFFICGRGADIIFAELFRLRNRGKRPLTQTGFRHCGKNAAQNRQRLAGPSLQGQQFRSAQRDRKSVRSGIFEFIIGELLFRFRYHSGGDQSVNATPCGVADRFGIGGDGGVFRIMPVEISRNGIVTGRCGVVPRLPVSVGMRGVFGESRNRQKNEGAKRRRKDSAFNGSGPHGFFLRLFRRRSDFRGGCGGS